MTATLAPALADPRPRVEDGPDGPAVLGVRCSACGHPCALQVPRCPRCRAPTEAGHFGPDGVLWATTTIHVASGGHAAPYTLGYVDLDEGPRVLAHVANGPELVPHVAERVRLVGSTDLGDLRVELRR